jgi:2-polyprenyl-3-methyl-5-hydroxy-6-metoxy-1,4-benzoquinol methylase
VDARAVVEAWDRAGPDCAHPSRGVSETAYWQSGADQAGAIARDLPRRARVLDFGAGDGRIAIPLARLGYTVTAADASPRMLAALHAAAPTMQVLLNDGLDGGALPRHAFDAAVCVAVLIHHSYDTAHRIIETLAAAVRPGGLLFLDWPTSPDPAEGQVWTDVTTWHPDQQAEVAAEYGLTRLRRRRPWSVYRTSLQAEYES